MRAFSVERIFKAMIMAAAAGGSPGRDSSIDVARGIGMIFVVIGHMIEFDDWRIYIYLFHMPLFFILSGILFKNKGTFDFVCDKIMSLMVPYIFFIIVVLLFDNALSVLSGVKSFLDISNPSYFLPRIIFGGPSLVAAFTIFWFVGCLWIASSLYNAVLNKSASLFDWRVLAFVGGSYLVSMVEKPGLMLPQGLGAVPLAIVFIWVGSVFASLRDRRPLLLVGSLACAVMLFPLVGTLDMKAAQNGNVANLPFAVAASIIIIVGSSYIGRSKFLAGWLVLIGQSSLTVMFLHNLVIIHGRVFLPNRYLLLIGAIAIPVLIHLLLERSELTRRFALGRSWRRHKPEPFAA